MKANWLTGNAGIVPVVMFHSVGAEHLDWEYRHISEPVAVFEDKLASLAKSGFHFLVWSDLYAYMSGKKHMPTPSIMLTFDDGYLDNWVYIYPLLKKYGARGTIYVSPDFVDPSTECRPNADDGQAVSLRVDGFLNWEEMRVMERSGIIDIQSHANSHTWYFSGPQLIDIWKPGQREHSWMAWNTRPERKPYYLSESQWGFVELGTPVYEHDKELCVRRFFPAEEIAVLMQAYVADNGEERFFDNNDAIDRLTERHNDLLAEFVSQCHYETDEERRARTKAELLRGKHEIERHLDKQVDYICWPGGGYDRITLDVAREVGFKAWTLGSADQSDFRNNFAVGPEQVKRIGSSTWQTFRGKKLGYTSGREFARLIKRHQGSRLHKALFRLSKLGRIARAGY